jgi:hypothetical protein
MIFIMILTVLLMLVSLTVIREYRRSKTLTLVSLLSLGNILYMGVTPALYYYFPDSARIFEGYVSDTGMSVEESGLIRVLLAAIIFQLVCFCVSLGGSRKRIPLDAINNKAVLKSAIIVGWVLVSIGGFGIIWLGLKYNGHLWGLYEISYLERATLARDNSLQAFMLLLGIYGAAQLIVIYLLSHRKKMAVLILFAMTLHGLGMKSKFPIFWVLLVFLIVTIGQRKQLLRLFLPIVFTILILSTMSILRGFENLSDLPEYIGNHWELLATTAAAPWNNDLPGPASITYYILNSDVDYTVRPVTEILWLMVPRFLFDRGPVLSDTWAEKMLGGGYEPGLGFGWSSICDGFLLLGWLGIGLAAFVFTMLARYIDNLGTKDGKHREFFVIVVYCSAPFFLYGVRESIGGLIKQLIIMTALIWLPTLYLAQKDDGVRLSFRTACRQGIKPS